MKIQALIVRNDPVQSTLEGDIQSKIPSKTSFEIDTETLVAAFAFVIALIFILFMGFGWLNNKATTAQFIQVGTIVTSGFTGIIIGIIEAQKKEQGTQKNKVLKFVQFFCITLALVLGGYARFRTL
jgi:hypothetical protein